MTHEEIIDCPKSGGDLCYKVQVTPDITTKCQLCLNCIKIWLGKTLKLN